MINVGIVGATGYTGVELIRLLLNHPKVNLTTVTSKSYAGQKISSVYPSLTGATDLICSDLNIEKLINDCDVVFIALPHGHAKELAEELLSAGKKVIDLGADFRLKDMGTYKQWYNEEPPKEKILQQAVYGIPEISREKIRNASLIANPGCYPTSSILALAPLVKEGLVDLKSIVIDAKSGVSGAGRSLGLGVHFTEVNDSFKAYKVASHRHTPEIEQEISNLAGTEVILSFTPHLVPMNRGILATIYAKLNSKGKELPTQDYLNQIYQNFYKDELFVQILEDQLPQTNWVSGTNICQITVTLDKRTGRVVVVSAIDNLIKGAAGQGIQNMNVMNGLPEETGLKLISRYL